LAVVERDTFFVAGDGARLFKYEGLPMEVQGAEQTSPSRLQVKVDYNGLVKDLTAEPEEKVKALLERAENAFNITQNRHTLALFNASGVELSDTQSLKEAGVKTGDELLLRPSRIKGGAR
jgi:hypothetical protein